MKASFQSGWRYTLQNLLEARWFQSFIIGSIIFNAVILGMETSDSLMAELGFFLKPLDKLCLAIFVIELVLKILAYRLNFFRDSWNIFDFVVVGIAFVPAAGPWAVLRTLRVLRILRLLTAAPSLKKVVAALLHAIPGLLGVILVMIVFFYTAAVLATELFGKTHPEWFGNIGASHYSLFQIMTLESWSMGIVRPVMESHPMAWAFFVPFIIIATFTILNLFLGIIVSTMQELDQLPQNTSESPQLMELLERMETDLKALKAVAIKNGKKSE